jgi:hypothetical protein
VSIKILDTISLSYDFSKCNVDPNKMNIETENSEGATTWKSVRSFSMVCDIGSIYGVCSGSRKNLQLNTETPMSQLVSASIFLV